jgi:hypothetical protein
MAAAGAEGGTMRRRLVEPAGRTREDARGGFPSFMRASLAPPAGLPIRDHPFEEHRRARRSRLSEESRLRRFDAAEASRDGNVGWRTTIPRGRQVYLTSAE